MTRSTRTPAETLTCYLVTDTRLCGGIDEVVATVDAAIDGGVTFVQVRDPHADDETFLALARRVVDTVAGRVPVVLNDRVHLVCASGADGAHIGQDDADPLVARQLLGSKAILGLSVQTLDHVATAMALPDGTIDHLGVGPVWGQQTKLDAAAPGGPELLARICAASPWPCVAIGGVGPETAAQVATAGAGMAVVSAICGTPDPRAATRALLEAHRRAAQPEQEKR
ncbi:thiamine phosphate synthase [Luteococcus sp. OSA5]|uniref:thiamine phosphate synthase n=1 Tax=Luteococcus sp. OSA5 TaxID=3401630 RepID=UPI003B42FF60